MLKTALSIIILSISAANLFAQFGQSKLGIAVNAVYTTSADVYLNPNSSDIEVRNKSFLIEDIWNPGLDIRYRFTYEFILGLSIEYIQKTRELPNLSAPINNQIYIFNVEDGFKAIPIELTAYYFFPFSTERFKFMMGGGLGYYYGNFIRKFADVDLEVTERKVSLGFLVASSIDYLIFDYLSARLEMKFRNPQFNVTSKYSKSVADYNGTPVPLLETPFETKVDINGVTFVFGLVFQI